MLGINTKPFNIIKLKMQNENSLINREDSEDLEKLLNHIKVSYVI